jgi:hypothetical protein
MARPPEPEGILRHTDFIRMVPTARPLLGCWLYGFDIRQQYPKLTATLPVGELQPEDIRADLFLQDCEALYDAYSHLHDDYPYIGGAFYGIPWMEAIMGCPIRFSGTSIWAVPIIDDWERHKWVQPTLENPWAAKLLELVEALVRFSNNRFYVGPTLMRGPVDIIAAMRGTANLVLDAYDHAEQILRMGKMCADIWIEVARAQLALLPSSGRGHACGCAGLRVWAPGPVVWLQEDALAVLSPRLYREFFVAQDRRIAEAFPYVAFHLHPTAAWVVDILLEMDGIDVLEINYDTGGPSLADVLRIWRRVSGRKPLVVEGEFTPDELAYVLTELQPLGLSLQTVAATVEQAEQLRVVFEQYCHSQPFGGSLTP